jgi:hypothetical protein
MLSFPPRKRASQRHFLAIRINAVGAAACRQYITDRLDLNQIVGI